MVNDMNHIAFDPAEVSMYGSGSRRKQKFVKLFTIRIPFDVDSGENGKEWKRKQR